MKKIHLHSSVAAAALLLVSGIQTGHGATADLADSPLATSSGNSVKPNLMFTLDDSGSMARDSLPDDVGNYSTSYNCKRYDATMNEQCRRGDPPWYASEYNKIYYNPQITYSPGVMPHSTIIGGSVPILSPQTNLSAVDRDAYDGSTSTTDNLASGYTEIVFCQSSSDDPNSSSSYTGGSPRCKKNGPNYVVPNSTYRNRKTKTNSSPFYYDLTPKEHCSDEALVNCTLSTVPTGSYIYPAPVRHCKSSTFASSSSAVTGSTSGSPRCQLKYAQSTHYYVRYGNFNRVDIVPATATYGGRPNRTDCEAKPVCTYDEEALNFANWHAYYRTRMQMMKTAAGRAFIPLDDRYRVGFITINPMSSSTVSSGKYLKIDDFTIAHKTNWYNKFYAQASNSGTPLREALARVGRHFAGKTDGINNGMTPDPMQYSCQPNFNILTTDGYWNGNAGVQLNGSSGIGNQDNVDSGYTSRSLYGAYDGGVSGASDTLADVAAYYYKTDLRPTGSTNANGDLVDENNVPTRTLSGDLNTQQHMTTFTVGLVDGLMTYRSDYYSVAEGDFYKIKTASSGCSWTSGVCNWPLPVHDTASALDDLWHAAVNGFGRYYNASNPVALSNGLQDALSEMGTVDGAASAAATSSPNVTNTDNSIFSTTYRTAKWDGEIKRQSIKMDGSINSTVEWAASALLDAKVQAASDTRTIYTFDAGATNKLKPFQWANLTTAERAYFTGKGVLLHQYSNLGTTEQGIANDGENLVRYLRGQTGNEMSGATGSFRDRDHVLGDTVSAKPAYVRAPRFNFADSGYASFKSSNAGRQAMLYIAANDGMLHAFNADTGQEAWAFVPRMVMQNMYKLAADDYEARHAFFVDGSPEVMDVQIGGTWKTLLVGGLNKGGRGYYALDITDPANPKALWEFCSDSTICSSNYDVNLGYTYGNPVITKNAAGNWVVLIASGYNNVSPGDGVGRLFTLDAATGAKISGATYSTASGSTTTPSGLAKISVWADDGDVDNTGLYAYGGDLNGDVWRFDLTATPLSPNPLKLAELKNGSTQTQAVTTRPELGVCNYRKMIFVGTGRYLGASDLSNSQTQSVYGFKDELGTTGLGNLHASSSMVQQTMTTDGTGNKRTITSNTVDLATKNGWFTDLPTAGERVNIDPQLVLGTLLVAANVPYSNACNAGGDSWLYQFDHCTGSFVSTATDDLIGQKVTGSTSVGFVVISLPTGEIKQIVTDSRGVKTPYAVAIGGVASGAQRVGWRELLN